MKNPCQIPDCSNPSRTRGWCTLHYQRWRHHGDPLGGGPGPKVLVAVVHPDGTKDCTECEKRLPLDDFGRDGNAHGGRRSKCKKCRVKKVTKWYRDNEERIRARQKAHYAANIDDIRARDSARYHRNKVERIKLVTDSVHRRRARMKGAQSDRGINHLSLRERDGSHCYLCGSEMSFEVLKKGLYNPRRATIEHIVPICQGGPHTWENVALSCWECNIRRRRKPA